MSLAAKQIPRLKKAAAKAHVKNTLAGGNLSDMANNENMNVPVIKPN
jgi:hypothetical protein